MIRKNVEDFQIINNLNNNLIIRHLLLKLKLESGIIFYFKLSILEGD